MLTVQNGLHYTENADLYIYTVYIYIYIFFFKKTNKKQGMLEIKGTL